MQAVVRRAGHPAPPSTRRRTRGASAALAVTLVAASLLPAPAGTASGAPACRRLAIIVHKASATQSLPLRALAALFTGEETRWPDGRPAVVITAPRGSELARTFKRRVLSGQVQRATLPGLPVPFHPLELPPARAISYVTLFKNAAAYTWADMVSERVRLLNVEGLARAEAADCTSRVP